VTVGRSASRSNAPVWRWTVEPLRCPDSTARSGVGLVLNFVPVGARRRPIFSPGQLDPNPVRFGLCCRAGARLAPDRSCRRRQADGASLGLVRPRQVVDRRAPPGPIARRSSARCERSTGVSRCRDDARALLWGNGRAGLVSLRAGGPPQTASGPSRRLTPPGHPRKPLFGQSRLMRSAIALPDHPGRSGPPRPEPSTTIAGSVCGCGCCTEIAARAVGRRVSRYVSRGGRCGASVELPRVMTIRRLAGRARPSQGKPPPVIPCSDGRRSGPPTRLHGSTRAASEGPDPVRPSSRPRPPRQRQDRERLLGRDCLLGCSIPNVPAPAGAGLGRAAAGDRSARVPASVCKRVSPPQGRGLMGDGGRADLGVVR
jgi:hypothetical protein